MCADARCSSSSRNLLIGKEIFAQLSIILLTLERHCIFLTGSSLTAMRVNSCNCSALLTCEVCTVMVEQAELNRGGCLE